MCGVCVITPNPGGKILIAVLLGEFFQLLNSVSGRQGSRCTGTGTDRPAEGQKRGEIPARPAGGEAQHPIWRAVSCTTYRAHNGG